MKVGVLIPTRGNRPQFLQQALKMLERQLLTVDFVEVVDDKPISNEKDITWRYRIGCERLVKKGADIIFFWEDDDYYSNNYLLKMWDGWNENGRPKLFGLNSTIYYHLKLKKWRRFEHPGRASAFCTMVTKDIVDFKWPNDSEPYMDLFLWKGLTGKAVDLGTIAVGIKHNVGLCGGNGHSSTGMYKLPDTSRMSWLSSIVDPEGMEFYRSL